jgi:hypothetical protein
MTAKTTNDTSRLLPTIGVIITDHTTMQRSATKSPSTKKNTLESSKKKTTPKKEKIHASKKQCIREDPTQLLEDENVHTGRKRSNKRRTRKTKKNHLLTYLLIYLPAIATPIKTPFYSLFLLSSHTAILPILTSRQPINPKPCTRETDREGPALTLGAAARKDKEGCTSRRAIEPRHQH